MSYYIKQTNNNPFEEIDFGLDKIISPVLTDFNGDGIVDLVGGTQAGKIRLFLGSADGSYEESEAQGLSGIDFGTNVRISFGDINGDGQRDALISSDDGGLRYFQFDSFRSRFVYNQNLHDYVSFVTIPTDSGYVKSVGDYHVNYGWWSQNKLPRHLADVNGDGFDDIVAFNADSVLVALSNGDGTFQHHIHDTDTGISLNNGWSSQHEYPRMLDDVNGDGRDDIVAFASYGTLVFLGQEDGTFGSQIYNNMQISTNHGWRSQNEYPRMLGDVNGDGSADIVAFGHSATFIFLSNGDGTFGGVSSVVPDFHTVYGWYNQDLLPRMLGDINGDGRDDIVAFSYGHVATSLANEDGSFSQFTHQDDLHLGLSDGWTSQNDMPRMLADVNGDGRDDIVAFAKDKTIAHLAKEDGSFETDYIFLSERYKEGETYVSQDRHTRLFGDVDGDGADDLVAFGQGATKVVNWKLKAEVEENSDSPSDNSTISEPQTSYVRQERSVERIRSEYATSLGDYHVNYGWGSQNKLPRHLADVNGDGFDDIVAFNADGVLVALSNGDGTFRHHIHDTDTGISLHNGWSSQHHYPRMLDDVNGDGRADIVAFASYGTLVFLGQEDGTFGSHIYNNMQISTNHGWRSQNEYPRMLGDVNGDGSADIVAFGHSETYVFLSNGDGTFGGVSSVVPDFHTVYGWYNQDLLPRMLGDINGDGRDDIVAFSYGHVATSLANEDGSFSQFTHQDDLHLGLSDGWTSQNDMPRMLADVNGDGRDDIVAFAKDETRVHFAKEDGSFETDYALLSERYKEGETYVSQDLHTRLFGDVDGDGTDDLVAFGQKDTKVVSWGEETSTILVDISEANSDGVSEIRIQKEGSEDYSIINRVVSYEDDGRIKTEAVKSSDDNEPKVITSEFADVDGDGDLDALVGYANGDVEIHLKQGDRYVFDSKLTNVGADAIPAMSDIDNDGDLDVLIGNQRGRLVYYERQENGCVEAAAEDNPFYYIHLGKDAKPTFADVDNDGDNDLVVGNRDGELHYYNNFIPTPSLVGREYVEEYDGSWHWQINRKYFSHSSTPRELADVNGDGRDDIVVFGTEGVFVALSSGQTVKEIASGNAVHRRPTYSRVSAWHELGHHQGWSDQNKHPRMMGHFNDDQYADIIAFGQETTRVYLGNGDGTFKSYINNYSLGLHRDWTGGEQHNKPRLIGDINGDGFDDIVVSWDGHVVDTFLSNGNGSFSWAQRRTDPVYDWSHQDTMPRMLDDVNGDGRDDLVTFGTWGVYTMLGNEDGSFSDVISSDLGMGIAHGWDSNNRYPRMLADMNGDGLADVVAFDEYGMLTHLGRKNGTFDTERIYLTEGHYHASSFASQDEYTRLVGDVDNDGLDDLVAFGTDETWIVRNDTIRPDQAADLFFGTQFGSSEQSIWHNGDAFNASWDFKEATGIEGIEEELSIGSKDFGFFGIDAGGAEIKLGLDAGFSISSGSADTTLPIVTWLGMPEGNGTTIKTGAFLAEEASFEAIFPHFNAYFEAEIKAGLNLPSVSLDVPLIGDYTLETADLLGAIPKLGDLLERYGATLDTTENWLGFDKSFGFNVGNLDSPEEISFAEDIATLGSGLGFNSPDGVESRRVDDFTLVATRNETLVSLAVDLDDLLTNGKAAPPFKLGWDESIGDVSLSATLDLLDIDLNVEFTVVQTLTLEVDELTGQMIFEDGSRTDTFSLKSGDEITDYRARAMDANGDGLRKIDLAITPQMSLRNQTDIFYDADLVVSALSAEVGYDVSIDLGVLGSLDFGDSYATDPLLSKPIDISSGRVYGYDKTLNSLDGFGTQQFTALTMDV